MSQPVPPQSSVLEARVEEISRHYRRNFADPRSHSRTRNEPAGDNQARLCWFHRRFAERATRCHGPCSWVGRDARNQGNCQ